MQWKNLLKCSQAAFNFYNVLVFIILIAKNVASMSYVRLKEEEEIIIIILLPPGKGT